jgi:perosamine synthetase
LNNPTTDIHLTSIPRVSEKAREYVQQVLDFGFHNASSPGFLERLERAFAAKFGAKYGIHHVNGTATMHSALIAAGVGVGDEVIVPTYTMASTALVALYVNAVPIFADVDPETLTISVEDIRRKITSRTKAIIPVAICGLAPDLDPIMALAREHNLIVVEDNAQCFLGYYKGRIVGSIGDFASFSFQGSKHMTCGDGGILICQDEKLALAARRAAVLGYSAISAKPGDSTIPQELRCHPSFARHVSLGYNFRLPEIAAAVALGELERLEELVEMRKLCARFFDEVVKDCKWLVPQRTPAGYIHSYFTYAAYITRDDLDWVEFRRKFIGLGGDGFYAALLPVHKEPVFQALSAEVESKPHRYPQWAGRMPDYRQVYCPVWEKLQPRMIQLKTNSFDVDTARRQADIFAETVRFFS